MLLKGPNLNPGNLPPGRRPQAILPLLSVRSFFFIPIFLLGRLAAADRAAELAASPAPVVRLDERRAVELALGKTLSIKLGLLQREGDRFSLRVARQQLRPRVDFASTSGQTRTLSNAEDEDPRLQADRAATTYGPQVTWRVPTGGEFSYSWNTSLGVARETVDDFRGDRSTTLETGWTVSLSQPLLRGGGWTVGRSGVKQAEIADRLSQLNLRATVIGAVNEVLGAYRTFVQAKEAASIARLSLGRGKHTLEVSRELLDAGRISRSEGTQAEAEVAGRELALITAVNAEDSSRLKLARLLDEPSSVQFEVQPPEKVERVTAQVGTALAIAHRSRIDFSASKLDGEAAKLGLAVARNSQLWDLRLAATRTQSSLHNATSSFQTAYDGLRRPDKQETFVGLTLKVPLWGDLERRQALLSANIAVRQHALRHENLRQDIESQVIDRIRNLEAAGKFLEIARQSRELAAKAVDDESFRFRSGLSSILNVARLEDRFVSSQMGELGALLGYLNAVTGLDETLGVTLQTWRVTLDSDQEDRPTISP